MKNTMQRYRKHGFYNNSQAKTSTLHMQKKHKKAVAATRSKIVTHRDYNAEDISKKPENEKVVPFHLPQRSSNKSQSAS